MSTKEHMQLRKDMEKLSMNMRGINKGVLFNEKRKRVSILRELLNQESNTKKTNKSISYR